MKDEFKICNTELISRFFDKELDAGEYARVAGHIRTCPACRKSLDEFATLSGDIKSHLTGSTEPDSARLEENVLKAIERKEAPWWIKSKEVLLSKKVLIPASVIASFVFIFFTLFYNPPVSGPSAIITSLSGGGSSVVILETPQTRQTILWFNEKG